MLFLGCKVDESRLCIVIIALASAIQSRWVMTVCLCCAVLISIVNMYFHKHCKQLSCRGYKSCFRDVLGVNSQEIKKPPPVSSLVWACACLYWPTRRVWVVTEGNKNSLNTDQWASGVGWQKSEKGLPRVALAPELQGCALATSPFQVLCLGW